MTTSILRASVLLLAAGTVSAQIRIGIVGTDTSHVPAFTRVLNDPANPDHIPGFRVVAAFPGGSPDLPSSRGRVAGYAAEIHEKWGVELVPDIASLAGKVDAVLLESVDGRAHLPQARQVFALGKPVFIDKPLASTLEGARAIAELAAAAHVPWFSSSSLRYGQLMDSAKLAGAFGVDVWGPGPLEPHHAVDLTWYGIHAVEMLYTLMGPGCETVTRITGGTDDFGTDVVTGRWKDGRVGTARLIRPNSGYGAVSFGPKSVQVGRTDVPPFNYVLLLRQIAQFFQTGVPPVPNEVTLEIMAFMDAAQRSKDAGGKAMPLR
jgi:hypothetical protein